MSKNVIVANGKPDKHLSHLKYNLGMFLGPLIFIILLLLPFSDISFKAKGGLGLLCWMVIWWITRPVNPTVTAFLPIPVIALTGIVPIENVLANYFRPIVVLLLGVILSNVMTITGSLSVVIPLMITTLHNLNIPPMPFIYMVAATANIAIMLPSSSGGPAIVASLGMNLGKMAAILG